MKRLLTLLVMLIIALNLFGAPFRFLPHKVTQPDGTVIACFVSGDEFFNWIHDKDGYSIIRGKDGYYYYAMKADDKIIASEHRVNSMLPSAAGLEKWVKISKDEYAKKRKRLEIPVKGDAVKAPHTGTFNNLVIYIRFSGESEIATTRSTYDNKLNKQKTPSLKSYFKEVSYEQLTIESTHYPFCSEPLTTNASYEDPHTRGYFQPYNATSNPIGYANDTQARLREHQLLVDAINWINVNDPVPAGINIDMDDDGSVDNICFMINGQSDAWSDLLWAHRWALWSFTAYINGKTVWDYTFQPENQVSVTTLCHEMFHALGAPDLYHYDDGGLNLDPVGYWDIMEHGKGHMGAYMKWKYADKNWIDTIPLITTPGTYTLNPLTSSTNNCYKILSPNSTKEFFIVEYRTKDGYFESNLPGEGLLVYRINKDYRGNAGFDNEYVFDEVYIYRPRGGPTTDGQVNSANFSLDVGRTVINDGTDPNCFLHNNSPGGLSISSVTTGGETISFYVGIESFTITATADPLKGGSLAGSGDYFAGETVHMVATPAFGYLFKNWTEDGTIVSHDANYNFTASSDRSLVGHFEIPSFTITTFTQPGNGGTVSGGGTYFNGDTITLTAIPAVGFEFISWTDNGTVISTDAVYRFPVTSDLSLVANFDTQVLDVASNVIPQASGSIEGEGSFQYGEIATLYAIPQSGYDFISWTENGSVISYLPGITFTVKTDRSFDANFALSTSLSDLQGKMEFEIYPNPGTGILYIRTNSILSTEYHIEVYNSSGILVGQKEVRNIGIEKLDLEYLTGGIYFLVIKGDDLYYSRKVIIR